MNRTSYVFARLRKRDKMTRFLAPNFSPPASSLHKSQLGFVLNLCGNANNCIDSLNVFLWQIFVLFFCLPISSINISGRNPEMVYCFFVARRVSSKLWWPKTGDWVCFLDELVGPPSWDRSKHPRLRNCLVDTGEKVYPMSNTWLKQVLNNALKAENYLCTDMYWLNCWLFFILLSMFGGDDVNEVNRTYEFTILFPWLQCIKWGSPPGPQPGWSIGPLVAYWTPNLFEICLLFNSKLFGIVLTKCHTFFSLKNSWQSFNIKFLTTVD